MIIIWLIINRMNTTQQINKLLDTGMTQMQLADALGRTQAYISLLANGKAGAKPSYDLVMRINALLSNADYQANTKTTKQL